jgi:hypothetical protein
METVTQIFGWIDQFNIENPYCDTTVIFLVILGGYFARRNLSQLPINITYSTLLAGTAFSCIYLLLMHVTGQPVNLVKAFISYCIATSCYDLFVKQIEGYLDKKGKKEN